jgi:uncharacterized protein YcbX
MPKLTTLTIYPVKSLRGHNPDSALVERMGLENDRRLMVVSPDGMFLTQRDHARMALITPTLQDENLTLSAAGMGALTVPLRRLGRRLNVEIWQSRGVESIDQGDLAAEWLSDFLKLPARLVRIADDYQRKVSPDYALSPEDQVGFADGFPMLIISQESLDELNRRLEKPIPMNRFRTNLVVSGGEPFAEDGWKRLRIGEVELALVKPCARCNVPTIDQETAESGKEPNTTLAKFRKINGKVMFGVNVIPVTLGRLRVGETVEILE